MKRDYSEVFQRIFTKYKNLILMFTGGGNLKNMFFSTIIFPRFCRYKKKDATFVSTSFRYFSPFSRYSTEKKILLFFKG